MRVAVQASFRVAVGLFVAGQVPNDKGLVTTSREQHIWVLQARSEGGNPATVALKLALKDISGSKPRGAARAIPRITNCSAILGSESDRRE